MTLIKRPCTLMLVLVALAATGCSQIKEGIVVSKFNGMNNASYAGLHPILSVDVEGRDEKGRLVRRSALLSQSEWSKIKIGDRFSFQGHSLFEQSVEKKK